jgi:coenzyme F420-0:L-glutamate ligase/coenzyme F420-1:gamma-L-glutamate ligase
MTEAIEVHPVNGIPYVEVGDDVTELILRATGSHGPTLMNGDVVVVSQKMVSKAEGALVRLDEIEPSTVSVRLAEELEKDARLVEVILEHSNRVVRTGGKVLITETEHGYVCANSGIDQSNIAEENTVSVLPRDPDATATLIRERIREERGVEVAVIIADTFGRPWRLGHVNFAIGVAGMSPFRDYRGTMDPYGNELKVTMMAVADELACAAELVMGKTRGIPVAVIRNYQAPPGEGSAAEMIRPPEQDLFR